MQVTFSLADALRAIGKTQENEFPSAAPVATPQVLDPLASLSTLSSPLTEPTLIDPTPSQPPESTLHCDCEIDPILFELPEGTEWYHDDVDQTILELSDWDEPAVSYPNDLKALRKYPAKKITEETLTARRARKMSNRKDRANPRRMEDYRIQMMEARLHVHLVRRAKGLPPLYTKKQTMAAVQEENVKRDRKRDRELKKRKRQDSMGDGEGDANPRPIKATKCSHPNAGQDPPAFKIPGLTLI